MILLESIFGISRKKIKIPAKIKKLIQEREQARKNKNWAADKYRKQIKSLKFEVKDTIAGPKIKAIIDN